MSLAPTFDQFMRSARRQGATAKAIIARLGCTRYRFYRMRRDQHWIPRLVILSAAAALVADDGGGLQTDITDFTGGAHV